MKNILHMTGIILFVMINSISCSNGGDENDGIVGTWRTTYKDAGGYIISISYMFKDDGQYYSSASYRGEGLPFMQLESKGHYTFSGTTLQTREEEYNIFDEEAGGSIGKYNGFTVNSTFPAKISGSLLSLSDFKLSALYIGEIKFKKE